MDKKKKILQLRKDLASYTYYDIREVCLMIDSDGNHTGDYMIKGQIEEKTFKNILSGMIKLWPKYEKCMKYYLTNNTFTFYFKD